MSNASAEYGTTEVTFPDDKILYEGDNILIAVMFSAESGEEFASLIGHISNESQLKFMSGIVDIMVVDTPLVFGTVKKCHVNNHLSKEHMNEPIKIKMPVDHVYYKN